jgi:lysophospholipase L1-like esterase
MGRSWVFLGDSLTEGVGSRRISYVTELAKQLRSDDGGANVHEFRLRRIETSFNQQIKFNVAGWINVGERYDFSDFWLWNFGCEGQTIDTDFNWLPLIAALRPELVVIFRGSLESIIRPAVLHSGEWPWWVPRSWRSYAAMDPRCYFSTTWWRKAKQAGIDGIKQRMRLKLVKEGHGRSLMDTDQLMSHQVALVKALRDLGPRVIVLGLLPVDEARFPGSPEQFRFVNERLCEVAGVEGAEFFDWAPLLKRKGRHEELFYRDGFHPNGAGAKALAALLETYLSI